jgi:phosphatidylglycerol:prolipoprotein diacylglycerol transferase
MLTHPQFEQVLFSVGPVTVRWYGLMYLIAFALSWGLAHVRIRKHYSTLCTKEELNEGAIYVVLSVVVGGRLGYVLFYNPLYYLQHPLEIFTFWVGGMSFHGGFLCVIFAMLFLAWKFKKNWWQGTDFLAPLIPLSLALGRIGNFINGELWGRVADPTLPWAMIFPQAGDDLPRHPVQLYHAALEGVLLFLILWFFSKKKRPDGVISAVFLIGYGVFRFLTEFFREPDHGLSDQIYAMGMGQWATPPIIVLGMAMFAIAYKKRWPPLAISGALIFGYGGFRALVWCFRAPVAEGIYSHASILSMGQCLSIPMIALGVFLLWVVYSRHTGITNRIRTILNPGCGVEDGGVK